MRPITDLQRRVAPFKVVSDYQPSGDQPAAIEEIVERINAGEQDVVLLGATGTGKTATVAWVAEQVQEEAERQYYDPAVIRRELEEVDRLRTAGEITEAEAEEAEDALVERLMESRRRPRSPKGS